MSQTLQSVVECAGQASWVDVATAIAAVAAITAAASAFFSYRLSKRIYDEIKSDEELVSGPVHHPGLQHREHDACVLRCSIFNKSKRKAFIRSVRAYDRDGQDIPISWSGRHNHLGNIEEPTGLLGVTDQVNLAIRRNDGEAFQFTRIAIRHSFSGSELVVEFDPYEGWDDER